MPPPGHELQLDCRTESEEPLPTTTTCGLSPSIASHSILWIQALGFRQRTYASSRRRTVDHTTIKRDLIAVRDRQILDRYSSGYSIRQLATEFGLTENGVVVVLQRHQAAREAQLLSDTICSQMRSVDDPGFPWAISDVLVVLALKGATQTGLRYHLEGRGAPSITLGELFDCIVSDAPHHSPGFAYCPIYNGRWVGVVSVRAIIESISARDFGPRTNALWERKLQILRQSSRFVGDRGRWSKPLNFTIPNPRGSDSTVR